MPELKLKSIMQKAKSRNHEEEQEAPTPDTSFSTAVLKAIGVEQEVHIPSEILTSSEVKGVQFRESTPKGYFYDDVDQWHSQVTDAISWYGDQLHSRNLDLHKIAQEIDRLSTDIQNHIYEKEALSSENNSLQTKLDHLEQSGGVAANMELQGKYEEALSDIVALRTEKESLEEQLAQAASPASDGVPLGEDERAAYEQWAAEVQEAYTALVEENEQLRAALTAQGEDPQGEQPYEYEEESPAEEYQEDPSPEEYYEEEAAATPAEEEYYEETEQEVVAPVEAHEEEPDDENVNRYAPELPPGTVLPSMEMIGKRSRAINDDIRPDSPLRTIREDEDPSKYF